MRRREDEGLVSVLLLVVRGFLIRLEKSGPNQFDDGRDEDDRPVPPVHHMFNDIPESLE